MNGHLFLIIAITEEHVTDQVQADFKMPVEPHTLHCSAARTSVIQPRRKVMPRWQPLASNTSEDHKQFLYHFPQLIYQLFLQTVSLIKFSVHKITRLVFKPKSKYESSVYARYTKSRVTSHKSRVTSHQ